MVNKIVNRIWFPSPPETSKPQLSKSTLTNAKKRPDGFISDAIFDLTSSRNSEVDWTAFYAVIEMINANPGTGITEAIAGIRYRLSIEDAVAIFFTLSVLDALFKNAGINFQNELSSKANLDFLQYDVIHRKSLAPENRGQLLELIAEWGIARDSRE
ncbi:hypothetical protein HK100_008117 [Physocladia obscura]|uniref:VHS domain-containing protein n=1 Tax=Physocladia obscura TaxID=109957 RepID=A0AAD5XH99_9FUNG|nr:hypothetical protein HK100_008117 [Physocladia obscura]